MKPFWSFPAPKRTNACFQQPPFRLLRADLMSGFLGLLILSQAENRGSLKPWRVLDFFLLNLLLLFKFIVFFEGGIGGWTWSPFFCVAMGFLHEKAHPGTFEDLPLRSKLYSSLFWLLRSFSFMFPWNFHVAFQGRFFFQIPWPSGRDHERVYSWCKKRIVSGNNSFKCFAFLLCSSM